MDDIRTELDKLEGRRVDYVMARSRTQSDSAALREIGLSGGTFYKWSQEERDHLNELAQKIKREAAFRAVIILQEAVEQAARVKVEGLHSRNERVKQDAASEILDRVAGKAAQRLEHTGEGGGAIQIDWGEVAINDSDNPG